MNCEEVISDLEQSVPLVMQSTGFSASFCCILERHCHLSITTGVGKELHSNVLKTKYHITLPGFALNHVVF